MIWDYLYIHTHTHLYMYMSIHTHIVADTSGIYQRVHLNNDKNDQGKRQSWTPKGEKELSNIIAFLRAHEFETQAQTDLIEIKGWILIYMKDRERTMDAFI